MVDGSTNSSMAVETKKIDGGGGNLRRYSMGKVISLSIDDQSISRRSSTGSCHDICKYGGKHSFEKKARAPLPKKAMKKSVDGQDSDQLVAVPEREKAIVCVTESKPSPDSGTCIGSDTDVVKCDVPVNSPSRQSTVMIEVMNGCMELVSKPKILPKIHKTTKLVVSSKQASTKTGEARFPKRPDSLWKPKTPKAKPVTSSASPGNIAVQINTSSRTGKGVRTSKGIGTEVVGNPIFRLNPKPVVAAANLPAIKTKNTKVAPHVVSHNKTRRARTKDGPNVELPEKTLYVINMETETKLVKTDQTEKHALKLCPKPRQSQNKNTKVVSRVVSQNKNMNVISRAPSQSKNTKVVSRVVSQNKNMNVISRAASQSKNTKVVSRVVSQNKTRRAQTKDAPKEKTLYVVNMETKTKHVESDQTEKHALKLSPKSPTSPYKPSSLPDCPSFSPRKEDQGEAKHTRNEAGSNKHGGIKKGEAHNGNKKGTSPRFLQTKGKDSSSLHLNFKNRKVVDLHSESHSPRRLKYVPGRSLWDDQKNKDGHRTRFKKVAVNEISKDPNQSEKVVLRHHHVQGKKDTQVLYNKVIAETARKLGQTRKSKVKALVGAFETVISLQDQQPSVRTIAA